VNLLRSANGKLKNVSFLNSEITLKSVESTFLEQIEELIFSGEPIEIPLRLMCQYSLVFGGVKPKLYDQFRKDICEAYGTQHIFTFQNLAKLGILTMYLGVKSNYSQVYKLLKLNSDYDSDHFNDVSAAYRGFVPISVRLVQAATRVLPQASDIKSTGVSWKGYEDVLQFLPGETIERSIIPETKNFKSSSIFLID
jgi:vacuolar protein sorting-associated protein 33A